MWWIVPLAIVGLFCVVIFFGAPYVPTMATQRQAALDLLNLRPGQVLYELGSGDGSLLIAAARQGIIAVGFELNPLLVIVAKIRIWRYRSLAKVHWANFWRTDISAADGIFVFLIGHFMTRLDRKLMTETTKPIRLASVAFKIPSRAAAAHRRGVYLYTYRPIAKL